MSLHERARPLFLFWDLRDSVVSLPETRGTASMRNSRIVLVSDAAPFQLGINLYFSVPGCHRVFALRLEELFRIESRSDPCQKGKLPALILSFRVQSCGHDRFKPFHTMKRLPIEMGGVVHGWADVPDRYYQTCHRRRGVQASMIFAGTIFLVAWTAIFERPRFTFLGPSLARGCSTGILATATAYLLWNWGVARLPAALAHESGYDS